VTLHTPRLILRRARLADLIEVNAFLGDLRAMRFWSTPPHAGLHETKAWLDRLIAAAPATNEDYMIELDGRVIGLAGSNPLPDFGFILHPDFWGRGLAREASRAVIDHIFAVHDVPALTAEADPRNAGSIALLERLGFVKTGEAKHTLQVGAKWVDSVYFRLDRGAR
jgi:ribosomal-protein-alanine N-acetyltransferase